MASRKEERANKRTQIVNVHETDGFFGKKIENLGLIGKKGVKKQNNQKSASVNACVISLQTVCKKIKALASKLKAVKQFA